MDNVELLKIVSFCVLMQNGEGIMSKPSHYIAEKFRHSFRHPWTMWCALDDDNQQIVRAWFAKWGRDAHAAIEVARKDYNGTMAPGG